MRTKIKVQKKYNESPKRVPPLYEIEAMNQTYLELFSSVCVPGYQYNLCGGCGDKAKGAAHTWLTSTKRFTNLNIVL